MSLVCRKESRKKSGKERKNGRKVANNERKEGRNERDK